MVFCIDLSASLQCNEFACEICKSSGNCSEEDHYIPIDQAVEQVRNDLPSLMQLVREKVDTIIQTRAKLDELLRRIDQERVCTPLYV